MINQKAIDAFLARKLNSYDWLKECSKAQLQAEIDQLTPPPNFGSIRLWKHQLACFLLLIELKRFMLHIDMGGGKTLLTLSLLKYRKQRGEKPKAVVFVPYITSVDTWVDETAKHTPELTCVPLIGTTAENLERLGGDGDLFVICYQSAVAMVTEKVPGKKGKAKWQLKAADVRDYFASFDMLVCDEIHRCKSTNSLTYRMCRAISARCEWVLGLTGTPFGKDLSDLWPQFYLVDFGETLGPTMSFFRGVFFNEKYNFWGGKDYTFKQKMMPQLEGMIKNRSIHYGVNEFTDMPEKEYIVRHIRQPEAAAGYVSKAMEDMQAAITNQSFKELESNYLKLRQLSSGFITLRGDDTKVQVAFDDNPKLEALAELVEDIPPTSKIVVFHHFIYTSELISTKLKAMKVGHARIWGGQRDPIGQLHKFRNDPKCRALVLNIKSGSSSLNLQNANYLVFFEQPDSPIDRQQAEARVWRSGQANRVLIFDLLVRGTVDVRLHQSNKRGENLLKQLLNGR